MPRLFYFDLYVWPAGLVGTVRGPLATSRSIGDLVNITDGRPHFAAVGIPRSLEAEGATEPLGAASHGPRLKLQDVTAQDISQARSIIDAVEREPDFDFFPLHEDF